MNSCTHQRTMLGRHATKYFYYYYQPTCRKLTPASFKAEIDGRRASPAAVVAQVVQVHVRRVNPPIFSTPMSFAVCSLPLTAVCSIRSEREPRRNVPGGYALADSQSKNGNSFFNSSFRAAAVLANLEGLGVFHLFAGLLAVQLNQQIAIAVGDLHVVLPAPTLFKAVLPGLEIGLVAWHVAGSASDNRPR